MLKTLVTITRLHLGRHTARIRAQVVDRGVLDDHAAVALAWADLVDTLSLREPQR